jgi:hypothetical protein
VATRQGFLRITGTTSRRVNKEEGKSGDSIIKNQQLFLVKMSETVI